MTHHAKRIFHSHLHGKHGLEPILSVLMVYVGLFVAGLLVGELVSDLSKLAMVTGGIATLTVFFLGFKIIARSVGHHRFMALAVVSMMVANLVYMTSDFSVPVVDMLYDLATILTMLVMYQISRRYHK